jgi:DNA repair exonuclease SbcCD ATPase subunit
MADLDKSQQELPTFDYSMLESGIAARLQDITDRINRAKQGYILQMARLVTEAHSLLCGELCNNYTTQKHGNRGEDSFNAWCEYIGVSRKTAYNLLSIQSLMDHSSEDEQKVLEQAPATLLYAAAKPSAPPELVEAVKAGDITTNKKYKEALNQINTLTEQNKSLLHSYETERGRADSAEKKVTGLQASYDTAHKNEEYTIERAKKLEQEKAETEKQLEGARQAMQAAKMRGDKLKAENEDLRTRPVEVAVDPDEVERRAAAKAEELTADLRRQLEEAKKPPASVDNGESEENRCYDQVIYANRLISSSWGLAKEFYRKLPSGGEDSLKHIAADMIGHSLEQIKEDLKCL